MSEPESGVGAALRTAREAQGLSIQDAARQLRLMNRQVVAMESEDFASLGPPVFVRGFVRNYARLLGLDAPTLLQYLGGQVEPVEVVQSAPLVLPKAWFTSGWLIAGMLALLVLTVVPIGLYAWLSSDSEEAAAPTPKPLPAPSVTTPPASVLSETPVAPPMQTLEQPAPVTEGVVPVAAEALPAPPVEPREMRFEFEANAWIEVKDGNGQILHRHMNYKGNNLTLTGQPPLDLVIGNATHVRMSYNGRPLDLKPYISANVARFSLEE